MKIAIELNNNELDSLKKLVRTALKCAKKSGLDMDVSINKQVESVANLFHNGVLDKEFDSFVVWTAIDGITAMVDHVGVWVIQTIRMIKGIDRIADKYDRRIKDYLEHTKDAE